ncbi:MAG: hypothetical protein M3Y89_05785 [Actinomycetota bacterium]|nr:hypothetical protein [Actinomycetota bacterium]
MDSQLAVRLVVDEDGGGAGDNLRSLYSWLADEPALRGQVSLIDAPVRPEQMGADATAVVVSLLTGGTATALARSLSVWLRYRKPQLSLKISQTSEGRLFEMTSDRANPAEIFQQIKALLDDSDKDAP